MIHTFLFLQQVVKPNLHVAGANGEEVPPVFIDRAGAKVGLIEQHSRNSKASLSMVMEQVIHHAQRSS